MRRFFYTLLSVKAGLFHVQEVTLLKLIHVGTGQVIAQQVSIAQTFFKRLKGLMFTRELPQGHALHLTPCRSIHTFFMNYSIDVLYLNEQWRIVYTEEHVAPRKFGKQCPEAISVVELTAGSIQHYGLEVEDELLFVKE